MSADEFRGIAEGLGRIANQWEIANLIAWRKLTVTERSYYNDIDYSPADDKIQRLLEIRKNR